MSGALALPTPFLAQNADLLREELGRFFQVADIEARGGTYHCDISMPDCAVDSYWHALSETSECDELTRSLTGAEFDHINDYDLFPESRGEGVIKWASTYERLFGALNRVWFTDENGNLNEAAYSRYMNGEVPKASWVCNPGRKEAAPAGEPKASWVCNPGRKEAAPAGEPKASWVCNPGRKEAAPAGEPKASWVCNPLRKEAVSEEVLNWASREELRKLLMSCEVTRDQRGAQAELLIPDGPITAHWNQFQNEVEYLPFSRHLTNMDARLVKCDARQLAKAEWVDAYEALFGALPMIWFIQANGNIDQQALDCYQLTGAFVRSPIGQVVFNERADRA